MNKLTIFILVLAIIGIGSYLVFREGSLPVNRSDNSKKIFVISPGSSLDDIIKNLSQQNLIRNRMVFYAIVKQKGIERKIQAGDFRLSSSMNAYEIADALTHGTLDIWVTIPEGLRKEEIAEILAKQVGISETEFNQSVLEGSLFPDTYLMPRGASVEQVVNILTSTMDKKYQEVSAEITAKGMTRREAIVLASLVEREAAGTDDRQEIANIIYKRWKEDWPLQIDATIQYALGYRPAEKLWWTKRLTQDDYQNVKSPYNTYLNRGLPPGPICNPGLQSLKAVADANPNTKNWYYYHDEKGRVYFSEDLSEHETNSKK